MAGRIREDDIAAVRERARIDEVIEQYVTLRNAGGGSRKGLCPFHDEKSPSFNVTPARGMYYCFGCGEGGDVFTFLQKIDQITFTEAVERLAAKYSISLTYVDGPAGPQRDFAQRGRLISINAAAAEFYVEQLATDRVAVTGRQFLADRGFGREAAEHFGVGFAPRDGEALYRHLHGRGFSDDDLIAAGVVARGNRGPYDRFRGRLIWPIREASGDVVGFGARRLFDDDRIEAKYLNTPETSLYKKSQVLYGVDLARKSISQSSQAVIVEGYTDVMACHEAGVTTAVATCGTAFGEDHGRILRRLLLDHEAMRGEVIFTFDGDEAGQKAAMRAFEGDAQFVAQTYVAVQADGLDPCDLRLQQGDAAVRELVATRIPLYRFVLRNVVERYDLDHADQRVDALRAAVELVSSVRDQGKVEQFVREIAQTVGVELDQVRRELGIVRRRPAKPTRRPSTGRTQPGRTEDSRTSETTAERNGSLVGEPAEPVAEPVPNLGEHRFADERELLKVTVQAPHLVVPHVKDLDGDDFTHPYTSAIWVALLAEGLPESDDTQWASRVRDQLTDPQVQRVFAHLSVDPLRATGTPDATLVDALVARVQELTVLRRIAELKSKLQRTNPLESPTDYNRMFGDLVALEQQRRQLRDKAIGGSVA